MFNGVGEQIQQFIATAAAASTAAIPLHLPLHVSPTIFPGFNSGVIDAPPPHPAVLPAHLLHGLPVRDNDSQEERQEEEESSRNIDLERDRSVSADPKGRWLEEESLGVMRRPRSGIESAFHDSVISRKFAGAGFNGMPENYPERTIGGGVSKYSKKLDGGKEAVATKLQGETRVLGSLNLEDYSGDDTPENASMEISNPAAAAAAGKESIMFSKKRKRSLEKMKGMCEEIVHNLMAQQEELHRKLLEDLEKREVERVEREEALRMQEIARLDGEIELRARDQALACTRDATIISLLKKFTSDEQRQQIFREDDEVDHRVAVLPNEATAATTRNNNPKTVTTTSSPTFVPNACKTRTASSPPLVLSTNTSTPAPTSVTTSAAANELGRRWPKAEVYSLINLRCSLFKTSEDKTSKVSLWERISQKMTELGYNRSAKRCKEKWENINKYFKKTKDATKKRPTDSKTCPYFHELSRLYNQGVLLLHHDAPENVPKSPENQTESTPSQGGSGYHEDAVHAAGENDSNAVFRVEY